MLSRLQSRHWFGNRWESYNRMTAPFQVCFHEGIASLVMTELAVLITTVRCISRQCTTVPPSRFETSPLLWVSTAPTVIFAQRNHFIFVWFDHHLKWGSLFRASFADSVMEGGPLTIRSPPTFSAIAEIPAFSALFPDFRIYGTVS